MTLDEFVLNQMKKLYYFKKYWIEENKKNPDEFPLEFAGDNDGLWEEMFDIFDGENYDRNS